MRESILQKTIAQNIRGLKKIYSLLSSQTLQQEAIKIAHNLSQSYKKQYFTFLCDYLTAQNRLISLKISTGIIVGNDIYYHCQYPIACLKLK